MRVSLDVIGFCIYGISSLPESNKDEPLILQMKTATQGPPAKAATDPQNPPRIASFSIHPSQNGSTIGNAKRLQVGPSGLVGDAKVIATSRQFTGERWSYFHPGIML